MPSLLLGMGTSDADELLEALRHRVCETPKADNTQPAAEIVQCVASQLLSSKTCELLRLLHQISFALRV